MAKLLKLRRGTDTQHSTFTGAEGEVTVNTTNDSLHVHDGITAGGREVARADLSNVSGTTEGGITVNGNLSLADSNKALFGTGNDLEIYHDGSNSAINDKGTGNLYIQGSSDVYIRDYDTSENMVTCTKNGAVNLYYDGLAKIGTTSTGINVTGTLEADTANITGTTTTNRLVVDDDGSSSPTVVIKADDTTPWALCVKNDTYSTDEEVGLKIYQNNSGTVQIQNKASGAGYNTLVIDQSSTGGSRNLIVADNNGSIGLFHGGNAKLDTTSTGINVTGEVNCDGLVCEGEASIRSSSGVLVLRDTGDSAALGAQCYIQGETSDATSRWRIGDVANGNGNIYISNLTGNSIVFQTAGTDRCAIDPSGHLKPQANNTYDLGTSAERWRNVYTNDLNLSNEGGTNDVDGTWGSWTIQEGEDDLFLLNRRNGKKYKFNLSEVN